MAGPQNVQIPLHLFNNLMSFFIYLQFSDHSFPSIYKFDEILSALQEKQHSINLRTAYTRIVYARDDMKRDSARADYLQLRHKRRGG